jgi:hypothetical protein
MKNFDIKRFGQLMKWTLISHRGELLSVTIILSMVQFFWLLLVIYASKDGVLYSVRLGNAMNATFEVFLLFFMLAPIVIIKELKTKQAKVNSLMLPATNMEKFISRYVEKALVFTLCFIVAFIAADLLQWVMSLIMHPAENGLVMAQISVIKTDLLVINTHLYPVFGILILWWLHSLYLLGGMFFRRHAWMIVTLLLIVLGIAFSSWIASAFDETTPMWIKSSLHLFEVLLAALVMFNYWASYRIFKRLQVINNKWINL